MLLLFFLVDVVTKKLYICFLFNLQFNYVKFWEFEKLKDDNTGIKRNTSEVPRKKTVVQTNEIKSSLFQNLQKINTFKPGPGADNLPIPHELLQLSQ